RDGAVRRRPGRVRSRRELQGPRRGQPVRRRHELLPLGERGEPGADGDGERDARRRPPDRAARREGRAAGGGAGMKMLVRLMGNGVVAGLAGTAAMTISSTIEAKLRGRPFSKAPAHAAQKVLGIKAFESSRDEGRFSDLV